MNRVLVTGATGYLGRALCQRLLDEGCEVTALSRGKGRAPLPGLKAVTADVADPESLAAAAGQYDVIYHLAGMVSFKPSMLESLMTANATGTANVLDAARAFGAGRVVVASSACTMGLSFRAGDVMDEASPADPALAARNPYMASKLAAEEVVRQAVEDGQDVVTVNPTTVYGPGDYSLNSGTLVLSVARSAVVPVPSGGGNVVDVDDAVEGMLLAAAKGKPGERYILGGYNLTFAQIVDAVAKAVGKKPLRLPLPALARKPMGLAAGLLGLVGAGRLITPQIVEDLFAYKFYSSAKARRELGFVPRRRFEETAARAWEFYRKEGLA